MSDVAQSSPVVASKAAHQCKRLIGVNQSKAAQRARSFRQRDPTSERTLELLGQCLSSLHASFLQDGDGGDIRKRLDDADITDVEPTCVTSEDVKRADDLVSQPHGEGMDGTETCLTCPRHEERPSRGRGEL